MVSASTDPPGTFDVVAVGAHPDDVEIVMGGTIALLSARGLRVLLVDLCDGEPTRYAPHGTRRAQALQAAELLGASRVILDFQDRLIADTPATRMAIAAVVRRCRPRYVFTSDGSGVHPDHKAVTDIVTHGVFYARLPSLQVLDSMNHRAIVVGWTFLTFGLLVGAVWTGQASAYAATEPRIQNMSLADPKIFAAVLCWIVYSRRTRRRAG